MSIAWTAKNRRIQDKRAAACKLAKTCYNERHDRFRAGSRQEVNAAVGMFGFDERYAMFDMTALDNQFILEYMPAAKGDYVKVYLYGLMMCHHPLEDMELQRFSRELNMKEEDVQAAYRYWERKGLVQRIADHPPAYRYVNVKQAVLTGAAPQADPAYEAFSEAVYGVFGNERRLHGKELNLCYEWVEDMGLPAEVVVALLQHLADTRGKRFSMTAAEKLAVELAEAGIATAEDAADYLAMEKDIRKGCQAVLRRIGQYRNPTEDEAGLYRKWMKEWHFKPDAIEEACADMTGGKPSFKYLDGILNKYRADDNAATGTELRKTREARKEEIEPLKKLLAAMNQRGLSINEGTLAAYREMRAVYPDEIILLAGRECASRGQGFDKVMAYLQVWQRQGLASADDVMAYMGEVGRQNAFIAQLWELWGKPHQPTASDRRLLNRWQSEWQLSPEVIVAAAAYASSAEKPMAYLDSVLGGYVQRGITTPEQVAEEHDQWQQKNAASAPLPQGKGPKVVREQQYTQRAYEQSEDALDRMMAAWKEESGDAQ